MIAIEQLEFGYREGDFRLRIPELSIEAGSTVAVIGPSGTGKTTLLNLVAGIMVPAAGKVRRTTVPADGAYRRHRERGKRPPWAGACPARKVLDKRLLTTLDAESAA